MKKLLITALLLSQQLNAYDITVTNETDQKVRVDIWNEGWTAPLCPTPNGGDTLQPNSTNSWPTHNDCPNEVSFYFPYPHASGHVTAKPGSNKFKIIYKNGTYTWDTN